MSNFERHLATWGMRRSKWASSVMNWLGLTIYRD